MHPLHHRLLRSLLVLTLFVAACSRGGESKGTTPPALDLSPGRQTDWLPADSAAVAHVDFKRFRDTPMFSVAVQGVTEPRARELLMQVDAIRGAFVMAKGELEFVMLVQGNFPAEFDMGAAMGAKSSDSLTWFKTPEGFWIGAKGALIEGLRTPPELRVARLSDHDWARAPTDDKLLAHLAFELPAEWRDAIAQKMAESTDPNVAAMLRPAVEELRVVSLDILRVDAQSAGLRLALSVDFESSRGAQTAGLMLQAMTAAAQAQLETQSESSSTAAGSAADAAAAVAGAAEEEPPASGSIAEQFGKELAKKMLSTATTKIEGNRVLASIQIDDAVILKMAEVIATEAKKSATSAPAQ